MLVEKLLTGVFAAVAAACAVVTGVVGIDTWVGLVSAEACGVFGVCTGMAGSSWWYGWHADRRHDAEIARRKAELGQQFSEAPDQLIAAVDPAPVLPLAVRLLTPWSWVIRKTGLRWVSGDPKLGAWWRYVLTEPADAAHSLPRLAACRWFGRHSRVCDGKRDSVHLAWRRARIEQRRRAA